MRFVRQSLVIILGLAGLTAGIYFLVAYASRQDPASGIERHAAINRRHTPRPAGVIPRGEDEGVQFSSREHHSRGGLSAVRGFLGILRTLLLIACITWIVNRLGILRRLSGLSR